MPILEHLLGFVQSNFCCGKCTENMTEQKAQCGVAECRLGPVEMNENS
jgi:hypothetical protein